jgi:hypothetical protein
MTDGTTIVNSTDTTNLGGAGGSLVIIIKSGSNNMGQKGTGY